MNPKNLLFSFSPACRGDIPSSDLKRRHSRPPLLLHPPSLFRLSLWIKVTFPSSITMKEWSYIRIRYHPSCMTTMNHLINCPTEKVPPFLENT